MRIPVLLVGFAILAWQSLAGAHGFIVPSHRVPVARSFTVQAVTVDATVKDQVADVQLSQVFRNSGNADMEVQYVFPVPPDAVISQFVLMVDGREMPAKLYTKEEARRIYESIVRTKKDPALLEYMGYGALQTSVFPLPRGQERKVTLRYTQLCRRDRDVTEYVLPLSSGKLSAKPIEKLDVTVRIDGPNKIKSVYSPAYPISVERPGDRNAVAKLTLHNVQPADDLRVLWTFSDKPIGATLLTYRPNPAEDGYFLLLASPEVKAEAASVASKTVVFVLDKSGSMSGQKIEQARNALKFVLNNLREGDTFNVIAYDDKVDPFKPELQRFDADLRSQAIRYVENIRDGGSTNINGALQAAFNMIGDTKRPAYVIFLTDGLPTAGETKESAIAENAKAANRSKARLCVFGVGYDVNARLLDRLSTENSGTTEYVKPAEDIEAAVARFYGRITAPVLTNVKVELANSDLNRVYPKETPDLFSGSQIVLAGRYRTAGATTLRITGTASDKLQTFEFPVMLAEKSTDDSYGFVEKLWATRRVGEIINELDLKGRNAELIDELVRLSTKHGILTPYTAFLADERTDLRAFRDNGRRAELNSFDAPDGFAKNASGAAGVNLRGAKGEMQRSVQVQSGQQGYVNAQGNYHVELGCTVVGNTAMFKRNGAWVDPSVTPDEEKTAEVVEQFSERYFELARDNGNLRRFLSLPEGCTVRDGGRVYKVVQPKGG